MLRDYRWWHTAFGGARAVDETGVVDASFGPAGFIETGMGFGKVNKTLLRESYAALDQALALIERGTPLQRAGYLVLIAPYLGDPADPSMVTKWRENPNDCRTGWHDRTIDELAELLRAVDLYVVWPRRMSSRQSKDVEKLNTELYVAYRQLRSEGNAKTASVRQAATLTGYSESRAWVIIRNRDGDTKPMAAIHDKAKKEYQQRQRASA